MKHKYKQDISEYNLWHRTTRSSLNEIYHSIIYNTGTTVLLDLNHASAAIYCVFVNLHITTFPFEQKASVNIDIFWEMLSETEWIAANIEYIFKR